MAKPRVSAAGGLAALTYVFRKGKEAGGLFRLYSRLRSRNACKTCALGMGGQRGGMVNEEGHFPEVCKKSIQATVGDMGRAITEEWFAANPIEKLARMTSRECEAAGRLTFPVIAEEGDDRFRRVGWDDALGRVAAALRDAPPDETFFYASGRSSNEAAFLFQLVARAYGTPHIHNCSYYCHSASGVALSKVYGSGTASVVLEDLRKTDLVLVAGANPASNHPRLITQLVDVRRRGGKVIVINPLRELGLTRFRIPSEPLSMLFGSKVSDLYLMPHIGTDTALLMALAKGVIEAGGVEGRFVSEHTSGLRELHESLAAVPTAELLAVCGVPAREVARAVDMLLRADRGIFAWAMGITHHTNGVENILALANLALLRGWLGKPGCGLMPIRGHSNIQGVGSVGVTPGVKRSFREKMAELYGIAAPAGPGQDTYSSMVAASEGRVRAAVLLGGNLWGSNPDLDFAGEALRKIPLTASITTKLNQGHVHGRGRTAILLPVLARDEESEATTQESMFNFVRVSDGGAPAVKGEMRSEVAVVAELAERILPEGRFDWSSLRSHRKLREEIAKVVPGYRAIGRIDDTRREFQIEGRTFHEPWFGTTDGRARFHVTKVPDFAPAEGEFRLMTLRSEGQFNTVVYEEEDLYRGNVRRDVVMMSAGDAARLGLAEGDRVTVTTVAGSMEVSAAIVPIRPGNLAMYYPEANVLVPRNLDRSSGTPAFKSVTARLTPRTG